MNLVKTLVAGCILLLLLANCTSLGHETRTMPKISKTIESVKEFGLDTDKNELSVGIKDLLSSRGYKIITSGLKARYSIRVRSSDLDTCVPEGSRQMHFNLTVVESTTGERVLEIVGKYGCKDTIIQRFDEWLAKINA